jgi:hypothetical protein
LCGDGGEGGVGVGGGGVEGGDGLGEQVARGADLVEHLGLMALLALQSPALSLSFYSSRVAASFGGVPPIVRVRASSRVRMKLMMITIRVIIMITIKLIVIIIRMMIHALRKEAAFGLIDKIMKMI